MGVGVILSGSGYTYLESRVQLRVEGSGNLGLRVVGLVFSFEDFIPGGAAPSAPLPLTLFRSIALSLSLALSLSRSLSLSLSLALALSQSRPLSLSQVGGAAPLLRRRVPGKPYTLNPETGYAYLKRDMRTGCMGCGVLGAGCGDKGLGLRGKCFPDGCRLSKNVNPTP